MPSKKTESIEIRVPPEIKAALKRKASSESKSISEALRELISGYIIDDEKAMPRHRISLGWLGSGLFAIVGLGLFSTAIAAADTVSLNVKGTFQNTHSESPRSADFSSPLTLVEGEEHTFTVGDPDDGYRVSVTLNETDEEHYFIRFGVYETHAADTDAIVQPTILIEPGGECTIEIGDGSGELYSITVETHAN